MRLSLAFSVLLAAFPAAAEDPARVAPPVAGDPRVLQEGCDSGRAADCLALGSAYADGDGVPADRPRALGLYEKACACGAATACYQLGLVHLFGADVPQDPARAALLLGKGCDGGEADACIELASAYDTGRPDTQILPRDEARAGALFERAFRVSDTACAAGDMRVCGVLAWLYTTGRGVDRDPARAAQLLQRGCDGGELAQCRRLGKMCAAGEGVVKDAARATELFARACRGGIHEACRDIKRLRWAEITGPARPLGNE
jgi:uncharacterized protein